MPPIVSPFCCCRGGAHRCAAGDRAGAGRRSSGRCVVPFSPPGSEKIQNFDGRDRHSRDEARRARDDDEDAAAERSARGRRAGRQICAQTGATGILVPTMRTEQAVRQRNYILTTGRLLATHVELRLSLVRCDGTLAWSGTAVGRQGVLQRQRAGGRRRRDHASDRARVGSLRGADAGYRATWGNRTPAARMPTGRRSPSFRSRRSAWNRTRYRLLRRRRRGKRYAARGADSS